MKTGLLRCNGCGAPLPVPKAGQTSLTCGYCSRELAVISGATHVTEQSTARALTDELLAGRRGPDVGTSRRYSVAEMRERDWQSLERGLWPVEARASSTWGGSHGPGALLGPPKVDLQVTHLADQR